MKRFLLIAACLVMASCGDSGAILKSQPSATSGAPAKTASAVTVVTTTKSTATPSTTSVAASASTCVNQNPSTAVPPIPKIANPKHAAHSTYKFSVDYPSGWFDGTDGSKIAASGLIDDVTLHAAGLKPTDTLSNMNVEDKSNFPGLTVYRFANFSDTAEAVAQRMVAFSQTATITKVSSIRAWCIDGTPATGFGLASATAFQESWFAVHGGALYYAFFIGKTDGTQATQNALESTFSSILVTWKWS